MFVFKKCLYVLKSVILNSAVMYPLISLELMIRYKFSVIAKLVLVRFKNFILNLITKKIKPDKTKCYSFMF